ncbi:hypothetical protein [Leptodesmis sp.]|uniref:hypothetical protein n=1 Tax=Leptodesmis sp. TaxID=3100501 RepID=UPI0040534F0A
MAAADLGVNAETMGKLLETESKTKIVAPKVELPLDLKHAEQVIIEKFSQLPKSL